MPVPHGCGQPAIGRTRVGEKSLREPAQRRNRRELPAAPWCALAVDKSRRCSACDRQRWPPSLGRLLTDSAACPQVNHNLHLCFRWACGTVGVGKQSRSPRLAQRALFDQPTSGLPGFPRFGFRGEESDSDERARPSSTCSTALSGRECDRGERLRGACVRRGSVDAHNHTTGAQLAARPCPFLEMQKKSKRRKAESWNRFPGEG